MELSVAVAIGDQSAALRAHLFAFVIRCSTTAHRTNLARFGRKAYDLEVASRGEADAFFGFDIVFNLATCR